MSFFTEIFGNLEAWWQGIWDNYWLPLSIVGGVLALSFFVACVRFGIQLALEIIGLFFFGIKWVVGKVIWFLGWLLGWLLGKLVLDPLIYCGVMLIYYGVVVPYHRIFGRYPAFYERLKMTHEN